MSRVLGLVGIHILKALVRNGRATVRVRRSSQSYSSLCIEGLVSKRVR